jgi:hypothetical protein
MTKKNLITDEQINKCGIAIQRKNIHHKKNDAPCCIMDEV